MIKTYRVKDIPGNTPGMLRANGLPPVGTTFKGVEDTATGLINGVYPWRLELVEELPEVGQATSKSVVISGSAVPGITVKREVLTIDKIGVGQTFIVHGVPDVVYVKISNSHVFNHKALQMHTTVAERFKAHLNLVVVELHVYNGK